MILRWLSSRRCTPVPTSGAVSKPAGKKETLNLNQTGGLDMGFAPLDHRSIEVMNG